MGSWEKFHREISIWTAVKFAVNDAICESEMFHSGRVNWRCCLVYSMSEGKDREAVLGERQRRPPVCCPGLYCLVALSVMLEMTSTWAVQFSSHLAIGDCEL